MSEAGATSDAVLRLNTEGLAWAQAGDEVVALLLARAEYLATNAAGTLLWPLLAEGATLDELAGALADRWNIDAERARADAEVFVADLRAQNLLEPAHR